jgi:hypothetical protein
MLRDVFFKKTFELKKRHRLPKESALQIFPNAFFLEKKPEVK